MKGGAACSSPFQKIDFLSLYKMSRIFDLFRSDHNIFVNACWVGDIKRVHALIAAGKSYPYDGYIAACKRGQLEVLKILYKIGVKIEHYGMEHILSNDYTECILWACDRYVISYNNFQRLLYTANADAIEFVLKKYGADRYKNSNIRRDNYKIYNNAKIMHTLMTNGFDVRTYSIPFDVVLELVNAGLERSQFPHAIYMFEAMDQNVSDTLLTYGIPNDIIKIIKTY